MLRCCALLAAGTAEALTALTARRRIRATATHAQRRRIQLSAAKDDGATLPGATYEIIHEDDDILVVDKGAGLLFVPGRQPHKHDSLISRIQMTHGDAVGVALSILTVPKSVPSADAGLASPLTMVSVAELSTRLISGPATPEPETANV